MPIMSALGSWRQKDQKLRVSGATWRELVLKKQKKQQKVKGITNALFTDKKPGTHEMQM